MQGVETETTSGLLNGNDEASTALANLPQPETSKTEVLLSTLSRAERRKIARSVCRQMGAPAGFYGRGHRPLFPWLFRSR